MILVDSSVWIDVFRDGSGTRGARLKTFVDKRDIVLSRLTEMELLQGARDESEWDILSRYLEGQEYLEPGPSTWRDAARIYFDLRRQGITIRSAIDCCLAQSAIEHKALLVHRDRDFDKIASIRPLQQVWLEWDE